MACGEEKAEGGLGGHTELRTKFYIPRHAINHWQDNCLVRVVVGAPEHL